ncbi:hypothetical protein HHK36_014307 [Tetracentron sinense]|uniref:Translation machinery-associated protein 22 n=1 Tax=Tetracentron sinense TaxID=13715 RepID=A0A834Z3R2_TETSI|nr:hypothetical protein HHK36_014307 [Tetracentron sinense]
MAEKPSPVPVLYCQVCSLPAEYCEFGPDFEKCKPWLIENAPELYPDLLKGFFFFFLPMRQTERKLIRFLNSSNRLEFLPVAAMQQLLLVTGWHIHLSNMGTEPSSTCIGLGSASASKQEEVKRLPGGKIKKKDKQEVVIEKVVRNKRKCITIVKGLDLFGVKLTDASKKLGKKFATGASVVKGPTEKEQIDVQGDIFYDIVEFITDTWPDVPESAIYFIEDGRKVAST